MGDNEMSVFGVSPTEEEIYRHFLRNPDTSADDIHLLVHTEQHDAKRSLDRLRTLGLLHPDSSHERVSPPTPAWPSPG